MPGRFLALALDPAVTVVEDHAAFGAVDDDVQVIAVADGRGAMAGANDPVNHRANDAARPREESHLTVATSAMIVAELPLGLPISVTVTEPSALRTSE